MDRMIVEFANKPNKTPFIPKDSKSNFAERIENIEVAKYDMNKGFVFSSVLNPINKGMAEKAKTELAANHIRTKPYPLRSFP